MILSESHLDRDPRVTVQIQSLQARYQLTCCGLSPPLDGSIPFIPFGTTYKSRQSQLLGLGGNRILLELLMKMKCYEQRYFFRKENRQTLRRLAGKCFDLIICNDVDSLPMAAALKDSARCKIYLDAHEYTPRQWDGDARFQPRMAYWDYMLKKYAGSVDLMTTVCQSIADEYEREFGLKSKNIVFNAPEYDANLEPSPMEKGRIRLIHHGGLNRKRAPEVMLDLMDMLDERFSLEFMVIPNRKAYLDEFVSSASRNPKISFRDPVPTKEIAKTINQFDVGLYLLDQASFNHRHALPNKFFEYLHAGLGVAIWPSCNMKRIADEGGFGIVSEDFTVESMAKKLNQISVEEVAVLKQAAVKAAPRYCSQKSAELIQENVKALVGE
ncbi:hypothetical protein [Roseiconus lacunae]|uniref:Glycosyltransferase subfamily 4-like N-terminal domain-containing protein n=1 Tax=Roseiconus lacunae TaxID=2605694 RepID=A0ABT7PEV8_9BACT|nr:hypothetical protein [Roseiconus lacunae]MDM4015029.1 hypothetical protein [Roseiconus lacunae]